MNSDHLGDLSSLSDCASTTIRAVAAEAEGVSASVASATGSSMVDTVWIKVGSLARDTDPMASWRLTCDSVDIREG